LKERTFVIDVSEGMQNKIFNIRFRFGYVDAVLSDGTTKRIISHQGWEDNKSATIPVNTIKLKIIGMGTGTYPYVYEIWPSTTPTITQTNIYPNLTSSGLNDSLIEVKINYLSHLSQKLYSLDNGTTWQEYTKAFKVNGGDVIKAKAIDENGTASAITTYTVKAISDAISSKAFDNNQETIYTVAANTSNSFTIDNDIIGKKMRFYFTNTPATDGSIKVYDKSNTLLKTVTLTSQVTVIEIPEGAYKVTVTSGSSALNISEINLRPVIEKTKTKNPIITINDVNWGVSKTIEITYPEGYTNEYSLDGGETWTEYTSEFTITESSVVIARSIDANGEVVASSTFTVKKVDSKTPEVLIDIPDKITLNSDYTLPTSYKVGSSGGTPVCKIEDEIVTNTKDLSVGTYTVNCSLTNGVGVTSTTSKTFKIAELTFGEVILENNEIISANPTLTTSSNNTSDASGLYKSTATNDGSPTYYFRGNVENNYVDFAGQTWRIVRINEDGTIRLVMQNGINNTIYRFNNTASNNKLYMYYSNSNAKTQLTTWYNTNIASNENYSSKVATGDYYCEQAKVGVDVIYTANSGANMALLSSYTPNFKCSTDANGYGLVNSNVGTLSYDEVAHAGGYYNENNNYYLNNGSNYWIISPAGFYSGSTTHVWFISSPGRIYFNNTTTNYLLRPVINLKADIVVTGLGTSDSHWVVQ